VIGAPAGDEFDRLAGWTNFSDTDIEEDVVAILDHRVTRRRYGRAFLDSLPSACRLRSLDDLGDFLSRRGPFASAVAP